MQRKINGFRGFQNIVLRDWVNVWQLKFLWFKKVTSVLENNSSCSCSKSWSNSSCGLHRHIDILVSRCGTHRCSDGGRPCLHPSRDVKCDTSAVNMVTSVQWFQKKTESKMAPADMPNSTYLVHTLPGVTHCI